MGDRAGDRARHGERGRDEQLPATYLASHDLQGTSDLSEHAITCYTSRVDERLSGRVDESHHRPAVALLVMLWFSDGLVTNQTHVPTDLLGFQYVAPAPDPLVAALAPYLILVFAWPSTLAAPSFPGAGGPVMIVPAHRTRLPAGSSPSPVTARPPGRGGEEGDIMFGRLAVAAIIALALVWPHAASPEVVELNGGDWVQGALKEATPAGVVVEVGG